VRVGTAAIAFHSIVCSGLPSLDPGLRLSQKPVPSPTASAATTTLSIARLALSPSSTVSALSALYLLTPLHPVYLAGVAGVAALLVYEHSLVRPDDLSRVNAAFFTVNGWIGVFYFAVTCTARFLV